jgi:hypothetical protein
VSTLGLGSVFTFTIPLDIDQTAKVIQPKSKIGCQEFWKRNCLIAEDDGINFMLLKNYTVQNHTIRGQNGKKQLIYVQIIQTYL